MQIDSLKLLSPEIFKAKQLCIMGNGGISLDDSKEMDRSDVVVRFNNYGSRADVAKPLNKLRCDVLFTTFDLHSHGALPQHVVAGVPYPFHAERVMEKFDVWYPTATPWMVNPYWNLLMCRELNIKSDGYAHPFPSIGFTALWHLNRSGVLDSTRVVISGFNWYYEGSTDTIQGLDLKSDKHPQHFNHHYLGEVRWIKKHLYGKININFSLGCKHVLDRV